MLTRARILTDGSYTVTAISAVRAQTVTNLSLVSVSLNLSVPVYQYG